MESEKSIEQMASLLKALGNVKRLQIVYLLAEKEHKVGNLEKKIGISQSALSQHLAVLRAAKIVATRREAQSVYYSLSSKACRKLLELLSQITVD